MPRDISLERENHNINDVSSMTETDDNMVVPDNYIPIRIYDQFELETALEENAIAMAKKRKRKPCLDWQENMLN